jgi:hypothetical protein
MISLRIQPKDANHNPYFPTNAEIDLGAWDPSNTIEDVIFATVIQVEARYCLDYTETSVVDGTTGATLDPSKTLGQLGITDGSIIIVNGFTNGFFQ